MYTRELEYSHRGDTTTLITMGFGIPNRSPIFGLVNNKVLLFYNGLEYVYETMTGNYREDRIKIFGEGAYIKDHPPFIASESITEGIRARGYVRPQDVFIDVIDTVFPRNVSKLMRFPLKDLLMCRITNGIEVLQGVRQGETIEDVIRDINETMYGYIQRTRRDDRNAYVEVWIGIDNNTTYYSISCSLLET